ncbi:protoporphyrinogen oxidase [Candidatus Palauibacter sp.]|uniref:protoporphyrinogen oxidase n=1 Tax=Candidatus Palauibacter sp. TaxID=3101350 RepID=UPI003B023759
MRVGIIGGGITGLALTHALARLGVDSILFESSEEVGGVIRTARPDGRVVELGPQRTRLVAPVRRLVDELDLGAEILEARPGARLFIWAAERLRMVPSRPGALLTGDLLSPRGRARAALEPLTRGLRSGESVARYFRRKAGGEAYRRLFGPLISATFGSDPETMPASRVLPMLLDPLGVKRSLLAAARRRRPGDTPRACTFRAGMSTLPRAIAARHAGRVRFPAPVEEVRRSGRGFEIAHDGASPGSEVVDDVVLTVPAPEAARLLRTVAPGAADRLARLRYNRIAVCPLGVERAGEGFGFQVALGESWRTRGVTWNASLFGRDGVCTAYLGGGLDPEVAGWDSGRLESTAAAEYEAIHGAAASPICTARPRLPAYDASWGVLDGLELPRGITLAAGYTGRLGISSRIAEAEAVALRLAAKR